MDNLPRNHFRAILADPPWRFRTWNETNQGRAASNHYDLLHLEDICALPVKELMVKDAVLFLWSCWPMLEEAFQVIEAWGFKFKTCGFLWTKAHAGQLEMFQDEIDAWMGLGYWTRANTEPCLLATRGNIKRQDMGVRQAIIEPRREHSRKPNCVYERIERLVEGPYLELFARTERPGWTSWGNEVGKFKHAISRDMDRQD